MTDPRDHDGPIPVITMAEMRTEAKLADIDQKLRALRAMKRALVRLTAACVGRGPVSACPILESLDAEDES